MQYRDKSSDTADLIKTARDLHNITSAAGIPLLINDRVDVAIAVGAEGVHIGQDDIGRLIANVLCLLKLSFACNPLRALHNNLTDIATARELLGDDAIIGVTASSEEEAIAAVKGGADYLGIGTVFPTSTSVGVTE